MLLWRSIFSTVSQTQKLHTNLNIVSKFISVSDAELKRLKDAFKRVPSVSGFMSENVFMREVLWDGVPPKLAQVTIESCKRKLPWTFFIFFVTSE